MEKKQVQSLLSYEKAVEKVRSDPNLARLIEYSYLDSDYRSAWRRFRESEEWQEVIRLLDLGGVKKQARILDIGCGNGIASAAFHESGYHVIALDPDCSKIVGSGVIANDQQISIPVIKAFAERLPFSSSTIDIIYGRQVLHHFNSLEVGVGECARVLRTGARALFCREHVIDNHASLEEFLENHPLQKYHGGEYAYTLKQYLETFKKAGFKIEKVIACFDSVLNHYPTSNQDVKNWLEAGLKRRLGIKIGNLLSRSSWIEIIFRKYLSMKCRLPGRLYSFLLRKR